MARQRVKIVIVSPALADANNGNWQTARRWQHFLAPRFAARIVKQWPDEQAVDDRIMLALHARRSAAAIAAWQQKHGAGLAVILTGTDLYRDIQGDTAAQASLRFAQTLVVLQERGPLALPEALRAKTRVIFQSTTTRRQLVKPTRHLRALMVGHLREEKSPDTLFAAARHLTQHRDIRIDHIGAPLDPALGAMAQATALACPRYRWLGGLPHATTRQRIQRAHVLVHASRMEGGAHVVMEAIASGTPVLASRIEGNLGMLGADYKGYFNWGDARQLAALLAQCRASQHEPDGLLAELANQCQQRAPLFAPAVERSAVQGLADALLGQSADPTHVDDAADSHDQHQ